MKPDSDLMFLNESAPEVAPKLLGCILQRKINGKHLAGRIVETEAYTQTDAASHSYRGQTPRTEIMFGPAGYLYVYFTYGMHFCCNVVVGAPGQGQAVLIRALEPLTGVEEMRSRRSITSDTNLTNGPAKLCQALSIERQLNGHDLRREPLVLVPQHLDPNEQIIQTTRIGISKAKEEPWRFYVKDNTYVSKP